MPSECLGIPKSNGKWSTKNNKNLWPENETVDVCLSDSSSESKYHPNTFKAKPSTAITTKFSPSGLLSTKNSFCKTLTRSKFATKTIKLTTKPPNSGSFTYTLVRTKTYPRHNAYTKPNVSKTIKLTTKSPKSGFFYLHVGKNKKLS